MKAADALDGHDLAGHQAVDRRSHRIVGRNLCSVWRDQPDARPAHRAGVGLRVEAAVRGIVVLRLAGRAHGEARHRGLRTVVGNAARDGEARAAVGAVQKWIAVAAVVGIEQLAQAVRAGGRVGGNAGADLAAASLATMRKSCSRLWTERLAHRNRVDARKRRRLGFEPAAKCFHPLGRPLNLDRHPAGIVADESRQVSPPARAGRRKAGSRRPAPRRALRIAHVAAALRAVLVLVEIRASSLCLAQRPSIAHENLAHFSLLANSATRVCGRSADLGRKRLV